MESITNKYKWMGVVTLFNPSLKELESKLCSYASGLDFLLLWVNSPMNDEDKSTLKECLERMDVNYHLHFSSENVCIAPAINEAMAYGIAHAYNFLLIMDQDSQWSHFLAYRHDVEKCWSAGEHAAFTPYVAGYDAWVIRHNIEHRRFFINSGTVLHLSILEKIGGADIAFPLDALDMDLSVRIQQAGYMIDCLTANMLYHTIGAPKRSRWLKLLTNDYNAYRTYTIARSHLIFVRKHHEWLTWKELLITFREHYFYKFFRIILVESDKRERMKMLFKGIKDGLNYKL